MTSGFDNDVVYAKNIDLRGVSPVVGQFTADGQMLIGAAVAPFARIGTLTAGTGITVTNGAGSITLAVSGSGVGQTITGDSGGALSPTAGNWNIVSTSTNGIDTSGSGSTLTVGMATPYADGDFEFRSAVSGATRTLSVTNTSNTASSQATMLTSVAGTSSGDAWHQWNIGTTRSFSLGIDNSDTNDSLKFTTDSDGTVDPSSGTYLGAINPTSGGFEWGPLSNGTSSAQIALSLAKNVDDFFGLQAYNASSGTSAAAGLSLVNDAVNATISLPSSASFYANIRNALFINAGAGTIGTVQSFPATGNNSWWSTLAAGQFCGQVTGSQTWELGRDSAGTSDTSRIVSTAKNWDGSTTIGVSNTNPGASAFAGFIMNNDATFATMTVPSSTNSTAAIRNATYFNANHTSNTGFIWDTTGSGSHKWYANLAGGGLLATLNASGMTIPAQPAFFAYLDTTVSNVTGNNTVYTVIFENDSTAPAFDTRSNYDTGTGVFTAPIAGRYRFEAGVYATGITAVADTFLVRFNINSGSKYVEFNQAFTAGASPYSENTGTLTAMLSLAASDTVKVEIRGQGEAGDVWDLTGETGGRIFSWFSGQLCT